MGFLAPAFLLGALAVAIPIVLHLARRRTDRVVEFPAAHMVPDAPMPLRERRRLRDLLLLALRAAALVLLALSFARPYFTGDAAPVAPSTTVIAVDTSLSLSAPGQWSAAMAEAARVLGETPATHLVGLVRFDDRASLVVAPTPDRAQVRGALADLAPGGGGTRYAGALARAAEAMGASGGRIVVVTDLQRVGWSSEDASGVPDGVAVEVAAVPPPAANLALTAVDRVGRRVTARVQSFAPAPRAVTATATVDGREVSRARVEVAPHASAEAVIETDWPSSGVLAVSIDDGDGYVGDNVRYLSLAAGPPTSLLVLTSAPPESETTGIYVQRALEAGLSDGTTRAADVRVTDGRRFRIDPATPPAAVFVIGTRTLDRAGRAALAGYVRGGGRLFLTLGPDVDLPSLPEVIGPGLRMAPEPVEASGREAALVPADRRHPALRQLMGSSSSIGGLAVERYQRILDESGWTVLARFAGGSLALAERRIDDGVIVLFTSDLDNRWNRFPLEPGFAPFIVEAARYLTKDGRMASSFTLPDVPAALPPAAGAHQLAGADGASPRTVVVNVNPRESDPSFVSAEAFAAAVSRRGPLAQPKAADEARARESSQRLWQIGLVAMLGVLVAEGVLGRVARAPTGGEPGVG